MWVKLICRWYNFIIEKLKISIETIRIREFDKEAEDKINIQRHEAFLYASGYWFKMEMGKIIPLALVRKAWESGFLSSRRLQAKYLGSWHWSDSFQSHEALRTSTSLCHVPVLYQSLSWPQTFLFTIFMGFLSSTLHWTNPNAIHPHSFQFLLNKFFYWAL